jgi:hypothetical protein
MEGHGPQTDSQVPEVCEDEDVAMRVPQAVPYPLETQVEKHQVRDSVHDFSAVIRDAVVLSVM